MSVCPAMGGRAPVRRSGLSRFRHGVLRSIFQTPCAYPVETATWLRLGGLRAYFNGFGGYSRKNYGFSGNLPLAHIASVCFVGSQPALSDQNLGRIAHAFLVPDNAGAELLNFSCGDAGFAPVVYEPIK